MPSEIRIPYAKMQQHNGRSDEWLRNNAGVGSVRYGGREGEIKQ